MMWGRNGVGVDFSGSLGNFHAGFNLEGPSRTKTTLEMRTIIILLDNIVPRWFTGTVVRYRTFPIAIIRNTLCINIETTHISNSRVLIISINIDFIILNTSY